MKMKLELVLKEYAEFKQTRKKGRYAICPSMETSKIKAKQTFINLNQHQQK
jgi:hypothetical protein